MPFKTILNDPTSALSRSVQSRRSVHALVRTLAEQSPPLRGRKRTARIAGRIGLNHNCEAGESHGRNHSGDSGMRTDEWVLGNELPAGSSNEVRPTLNSRLSTLDRGSDATFGCGGAAPGCGGAAPGCGGAAPGCGGAAPRASGRAVTPWSGRPASGHGRRTRGERFPRRRGRRCSGGPSRSRA